MIKLYGRIQPKRLFGEVKINYGAYNGKLQAKTIAPSQEEQTVFPDSGFKGLSHVIVEAATLQEKTIKPSGIEQTVVPDVGVYGLSKVIVEAQGNHGLLEDKTVSPSEEEQILEPSDGYYGIQSVTVKAAPLEEKTATSTDQDQIVKPSEGFYGMDKVTVKGIPNAEDYTFCEAETFPAIPADVLAANPYALIAKTMIGGASAYLLAVSASAFFYGKAGAERGLGTAGSGTMYYVTVGGVAWSKINDFTAGNGVAALGASDALMWANHDVTDVNEGFTYFAKSDVYPAASAEVYRIQKETADDIGREINRLWKTAEPMTAERMKEKLEDLDIELTELTVYPTDEVQEITPDGYYGFSKIIVEAVEDSGGTGGGGDGDDGGDTGDDNEPKYPSFEDSALTYEAVTTEVPTGRYKYGTLNKTLPACPYTFPYQELYWGNKIVITQFSVVPYLPSKTDSYLWAYRPYSKLSYTYDEDTDTWVAGKISNSSGTSGATNTYSNYSKNYTYWSNFDICDANGNLIQAAREMKPETVVTETYAPAATDAIYTVTGDTVTSLGATVYQITGEQATNPEAMIAALNRFAAVNKPKEETTS